MNKQKVLIVGAVQGEIPLVDAFHKLGCYVIVATHPTNYPCCDIADKVYDVNIMDKEALLKIAQEEKISAITSNVVERAIRIVAWVAERLELPGIGYEVAEAFTNKYKMRIAAEKAGVAVPKFKEIHSVEEAIEFGDKYGYPLMMKPVDNGGSKGVNKIHNRQELIDNFEDSLRNSVSDNSVIIEQFIEGVEYNVDAFTHNYICDNTNTATKERFDIEDTCIPKCYVLKDAKSCDSEFEKRLLAVNKQLVEGMGLNFGITHANYIYRESDDKFYLVEITARGGGDGISAHLVELATGVNPSYLLACYSLGNDVLANGHIQIKEGASAWYGFSLSEGEIIKVEGVEDVLKIPGVYGINTPSFPVGKQVKKLVDGTTKHGPVWVYGRTREECQAIREEVKKVLKITVRTPEGLMEGIKW